MAGFLWSLSAVGLAHKGFFTRGGRGRVIGIRRGCARPKDTRPETESIKPRPCPKSIYPLASIRPGTSCLDLVSSTAFIENRFGFASSSLLWSRLSHCRLPITGAVYQLPYRNLRNLSRGRYTRMFRAKDILSKKRCVEFSFCASFFCIFLMGLRCSACTRWFVLLFCLIKILYPLEIGESWSFYHFLCTIFVFLCPVCYSTYYAILYLKKRNTACFKY